MDYANRERLQQWSRAQALRFREYHSVDHPVGNNHRTAANLAIIIQFTRHLIQGQFHYLKFLKTTRACYGQHVRRKGGQGKFPDKLNRNLRLIPALHPPRWREPDSDRLALCPVHQRVQRPGPAPEC